MFDYCAKRERTAPPLPFMTCSRLAREYETIPEGSAAMIFWAMTDNMSRRLTGETTPTWRDDPAETGEPSLT